MNQDSLSKQIGIPLALSRWLSGTRGTVTCTQAQTGTLQWFRPPPIDMTILHVFSGDLWAGTEKMACTLLRRLQGHSDLELLALSLNDGTLSRALQEAGIATLVIPESRHSFGEIFLRALHHLKGRKIKIIHAHGYKQNLLALLIGRCKGVKCLISTLHGLSESYPIRPPSKDSIGFKTQMDYFLLRRAYTQAIAVSHDIKNVLISRHGFDEAKIKVIYNGIEIPKLKAMRRAENSAIHVGTVGRMVPVKDFGLFLEIAAVLRKKMVNVRFSILGEGPLKEELMRRVKDLQLEGMVEFEVPRADPQEYYESLDLYMNTSVHEGIPLSILEAMASGIPVVAPQVGGIPEIITHGEHGLLVNSRNPEEFANRCLELIRDPQHRIAMGRKAYERVASSFSSNQMAEAYRRLYHSLNAGQSTVVNP